MAKVKLLYEDTQHDYNILKEDILIYANQIGIDTNTEEHLMWIAEKGLSAKVPNPWLILSDDKNRIFYYNQKTGEKSWNHPLDKKFADLVIDERSKSLNSVSSDYGFESKLSSLADAPPLSSSGKTTPPSSRLGRGETGFQPKKLDFGHIENRRGGQLAPVKLNALKMPPATQKPSTGVSFMPKGSTLSRSLKLVREKTVHDDTSYQQGKHISPPDDINESTNSDDGSKYSCEESDDEDKNSHDMEQYDSYGASQLSPAQSADESPDALEINSLVQLGTKLAPKFDNFKKEEHVENRLNRENSPSLSLRKINQPSFLKPLTQPLTPQPIKKKSKTKTKNKSFNENENLESKLLVANEDQSFMIDQGSKEWKNMQEKLVKEEREKCEEIVKVLEEEKLKLRNQHSEQISQMNKELAKKLEEEKIKAEKSLEALKNSNKEEIQEEENKHLEELKKLEESFKLEIKRIKEEHAKELTEKKQQLEDCAKKELEVLQHTHDSQKKSIEEMHLVEISKLQEENRKKIEELQKFQEVDENGIKNEEKNIDSAKLDKLETKANNLEELIKNETEKYQKLLEDKEQLEKKISSENQNLEKIKLEIDRSENRAEELQDDIEKMEAELDFLHGEESKLLSELKIIKENIKNEKSNLLNLEKKTKLPVKDTEEFIETGVNTYSTFISTTSISSQAVVSNDHVSCQTEDKKVLCDVTCQTITLQITANKSCQVDTVPCNDKDDYKANMREERAHANIIADKAIENALMGLNSKLDSRIGVIEQQLKLLQEHLTKTSDQHTISSPRNVQNLSDVRSEANVNHQSASESFMMENLLPLGIFSNSIPTSSQNQVHIKCKCDIGDPGSCDVMQDVKNSIYHLSDILNNGFVPSLKSSNLHQTNQPLINYSSPFESFYAQLREIQEKHRLTELRHKCDNETVKQVKNSTMKVSGNIFAKKSVNPSLQVPSSLYSYTSEDPLIQARNLVLREKARMWKHQQELLKSSSHNILSSDTFKSSNGNFQSSVNELSSTFNNVPFQQSFHTFDDPETDFNAWMTRLNALQLRIRSHKML